MTKEEALKELRESDHGIFSVQGAYEIGAAFGLPVSKLPVEIHTDERSRAMGTTLFNAAEGDHRKGVAAHRLACAIARHLGQEAEGCLVVGRQLWYGCEAIVRALGLPVKVDE